jgi:hypothetical protein
MSIKASRFSGGPGTTNGGFNMKMISLAASALALSVAFAGSAFADNTAKIRTDAWGSKLNVVQLGDGNSSADIGSYANNTWYSVYQKGDWNKTEIDNTSKNTQGGAIVDVTMVGINNNDFAYYNDGDTSKLKAVMLSDKGDNSAIVNVRENIATSMDVTQISKNNNADLAASGITTTTTLLQATKEEFEKLSQ